MCIHCNNIEKGNKSKPFKKNGNLKKELKDLPRFNVIIEYEKEMKDDYIELLKDMTYDVSKRITEIILKK